MEKMLDSPWFLRFTALFLAILLFYNVKVEEDAKKSSSSGEEMEVIRNVPVEVYYDNENLIVTGVPKTVNVKVEGPANIVQTTKLLKDFTLFVDLRSLLIGEHEVRIEHENISDKLQVRIDPVTIDVNIEEKITETFRVEPEFNERLLEEGYHIANMEVEPSTIEVTGAKSVIESISFVKATISADAGIKKSFEQEAKVRVLDRDLNKLEVEMASETVKVKVEIDELMKEVPIVLNKKGIPPSGVTIQSIESEIDKITLSGPKRVLNEIDNFPVDIDVSDITKSGTFEIKLKKPKEIFQLSTTTLTVKVDVKVEDDAVDPGNDVETDTTLEGEKEPDKVEVSQIEGISIEVVGLNQQFKGTIIEPGDGSVNLIVKAPSDKMSSIKKSDFTITIDASGIEDEGENVYPILVKGPSQVEWTLSSKEAKIKIERI